MNRSATMPVATATAALAALVAGPAVASAATTPLPPCVQFSWATTPLHGVGFCQYSDGQTEYRFRTDNGGRSWRSIAATGVPSVESGRLVPARDVARSGVVYLAGSYGGGANYLSTDGGTTFTAADPTGGGSSDIGIPPLVPRTDQAGPPDGLLLAAGGGPTIPTRTSRIVQPPLVTPVPASVDQNLLFLAPTESSTVLLLGEHWVGTQEQDAVLYRCDGTFTCSTPLFAFPGTTARPSLVLHAWVSPFFAQDRTLVVLISPDALGHAPPQVWISRDAGAHFARWSSVNKMLNTDQVRTQVAWDGSNPRAMYLRLLRWETSRDDILVSHDSGNSWRSVLDAAGPASRHRRAPWAAGQVPIGATMDDLLFVSGHTMLVTAAKNPSDRGRAYCSTNDGHTWSTQC